MDIAQGEHRLDFHLWVFPRCWRNHTSLRAGHLAKDKQWVFQCPLPQRSGRGRQGCGSSQSGRDCTCRWLKGELTPRGHHPRSAHSGGSKADAQAWGALSSWVKPTRVKGHCDLLHNVRCPSIPHPDLAPTTPARPRPDRRPPSTGRSSGSLHPKPVALHPHLSCRSCQTSLCQPISSFLP